MKGRSKSKSIGNLEECRTFISCKNRRPASDPALITGDEGQAWTVKMLELSEEKCFQMLLVKKISFTFPSPKPFSIDKKNIATKIN